MQWDRQSAGQQLSQMQWHRKLQTAYFRGLPSVSGVWQVQGDLPQVLRFGQVHGSMRSLRWIGIPLLRRKWAQGQTPRQPRGQGRSTKLYRRAFIAFTGSSETVGS